jgi:transcription initiation factor IIF auxiliary subunit
MYRVSFSDVGWLAEQSPGKLRAVILKLHNSFPKRKRMLEIH